MENKTKEELAELVRAQVAVIDGLTLELATRQPTAPDAPSVTVDVPPHPEPHTYTWSELEKKAIQDHTAHAVAAAEKDGYVLGYAKASLEGQHRRECAPEPECGQPAKPNADCSGEPTCCPDNEGYGCACSQAQPVAGELPPLPDPEWPAGEQESWRLGYAAAIAAQPVQQHAAVVGQEPVAWLKEWDSVGGARTGMRRVDLTPGCEPWLQNMFPKITALVPAAGVQPIIECMVCDGQGVRHDTDGEYIEKCPVCKGTGIAAGVQPFQQRVQPWMMACFGAEISADKAERNHRFFEEATELVQSLGMTASEAHQLVDYVYGRDIGEPPQEVGGVMVTLAALCLANKLDMHDAGEVELARIWTKVEAIRAKQAAKPKHSPLPQVVVAQPDSGRDAALEEAAEEIEQELRFMCEFMFGMGAARAPLGMTGGDVIDQEVLIEYAKAVALGKDPAKHTLNGRPLGDLRRALAAHPAPSSDAAMMEDPTEEMLNAARDWAVKKYGIGIGNDAAIGCWKAMRAAHPANGAQAGDLPEGWRIVPKKTCYALVEGNSVVASLAGPDAEENAAIIARVLAAAKKGGAA